MGLVPTLLNMYARNARSKQAHRAQAKMLAEQKQQYGQMSDYLEGVMRVPAPIPESPNLWRQTNPFSPRPDFRSNLLD